MTAQLPFYWNFWDIKEEHLLRLFQFQLWFFSSLIRTPLGLLKVFTTHINACTALCLLLLIRRDAKSGELVCVTAPSPCASLGPKGVFCVNYDNFRRYANFRCFLLVLGVFARFTCANIRHIQTSCQFPNPIWRSAVFCKANNGMQRWIIFTKYL